MDKIVERAREYAHTEWISELTDVAKESYIKGATEQKAIDDELCKSGEASDGYHTFSQLHPPKGGCLSKG